MFRRKTKQNSDTECFEKYDEIKFRRIVDARDTRNTAKILEESFHEAMMAKARLATIQAICGASSIEDRIVAATDYEFGLQILKKQLEDQLIYIGGGDEQLVSTVRFESVEETCRYVLSTINALLQNNE